MSKSGQHLLKVLAVVIGMCALSACQSVGTMAASSPAAKVDSGLGDLPHYRDWIDPSGRMQMNHITAAKDSTRWP